MLVHRAFTPVTLTLTFETKKELLDFKALCNACGQVQRLVNSNLDEDDGVDSVDLDRLLSQIHDHLRRG